MKNKKDFILIIIIVLTILFVVFNYINNLSRNNDDYQIQKTLERLENKNDDLQDGLDNLGLENQDKVGQNENQETQEVIEASNNIINQNLGERVLDRYACVGEFCDGSGADDGVNRSVVQVPLIIQGGDGDFGCGVSISYAPHWVPYTAGILNATYEKLFSLKAGAEINNDPYNTLGNYRKVHYQGVSIDNGVAKVQLAGSLNGGPGHCSVPEVREQVTAAALYFDTVESVEVYLNGSIYDWCAMDESDGEGPCPETPQLWVGNR